MADFVADNVLGAAYTGGNLEMHGSTLLAPSSNRVARTDLEEGTTRALMINAHRAIRCVAVSPSGNVLVAADESGGGVLASVERGTALHRMQFKGDVNDMRFSPEGELVAVGAGKEVQLWRPPSMLAKQVAPMQLVRSYGGFAERISCLSWSHDGSSIICGSHDMTARVFTRERLEGFKPPVLSGHRSELVAVALLRTGADDAADEAVTLTVDGALIRWTREKEGGDRFYFFQKHLFGRNRSVTCANIAQLGGGFDGTGESNAIVVAGFGDGAFTLRKLPSFDEVVTMSVASMPITAVRLGRGGEWAAVGCEAAGQVLVWEWRSERYVVKQRAHSGGVNGCDCSPDGSLVASAGEDGRVKVWEARAGTCFATLGQGESPVASVAFLPSGAGLVAACLDGAVRAYDLVRYRNFRVMVAPESSRLSDVCVDPAGEVVAAASLDDFRVLTWSLRTGELLDALAGHASPVPCLRFSPTEPILATASWDCTVRVWDVFQRKGSVECLPHQHDVLAVAFSPDGKALASSSLDGLICLWDPSEAKLVGTVEGRRDAKGGKLVNGSASRESPSGRCFTTLSFSPDSSLLIAGGNSKHLCLYDVRGRSLIHRFAVSSSRSLDGVLDYLSTKEVTNAGPLASLPETVGEEDDVEGPLGEEPMPGSSAPGSAAGSGAASGGSKRARRSAPARSRAVRFCPTGRSFVAATTEGLLRFARTAGVEAFDPVDLGEEATPQRARECSHKGKHSLALLLALRLNEQELVRTVIESVPPSEVDGVVRATPLAHSGPLLRVLAGMIERSSPHLEHALAWTRSFAFRAAVSQHALPPGLGPALRAATTALSRCHDDLASSAGSNLYALEYIAESTKGAGASHQP